MIEKFSKWLCSKAEENDEFQIKVVIYFVELMLFQIFEFVFLIILAMLFGAFKSVLLCMVGFIPFRTTAEGYHLNTKIGCVLASTISFILLGLIFKDSHWTINVIGGVAFALLLRKPKNLDKYY